MRQKDEAKKVEWLALEENKGKTEADWLTTLTPDARLVFENDHFVVGKILEEYRQRLADKVLPKRPTS